VVLPHPVLADVKAQEGKPRLVAFQGVIDVTFGFIQRQPGLCQPCHQELLTVLQDLAVLVKHHAIIRVRDDTRPRVHTGDRLIHPMQGNQSQQRRS